MSILCAKDIAARLRISERTAARMFRRGEIPAFKLSGRVWRTTEEELDRYLRRKLALRPAA